MGIIKALWGVVINLDLIVIILLVTGVLGLWKLKAASTQRFALSALATLFIFMLGDFPYSGRFILRHLENRFPQIEIPQDVHGLVITGGSLCLFETQVKGKAVYHKTAGRLIEGLKLAHQHSSAKIVFVGSKLENDEFLKLATALGVDQSRIQVVTSPALNAFEDIAREATKLAGDTKDKKWMLITSAFTMPRSLAVFQANQWNLTPCPVDYHTIGHGNDKNPAPYFTRLIVSFQDRLGLVAWNIAFREIAGLSNLYFSGATKTFFPKTDLPKTNLIVTDAPKT